MITKPPHLKKGDKVGIVSPSSTIAHFPRRFKRAIESLKSLDLDVVLGKNVLNSHGHNAGTVSERADDINNFFLDPSIKAILCTTGGFNANAILPELNYKLIQQNPKIFCGYSDITIINIAIYTKAQLVTFNAPTLLPVFGEYGGPNSETIKNFEKMLFSNHKFGEIEFLDYYTDKNLYWDKEDNSKPVMKKAKFPFSVNTGVSSGILIGGNLETLCLVGGTDYMPDFKNKILFLEEMGGSTSKTERDLTYLDQLGVFKNISGLIYGRPYQYRTISSDRTLYTILGEIGLKYNIPIIADVDCGHTIPMLTLPIGVNVTLDATNLKILFEESATM